MAASIVLRTFAFSCLTFGTWSSATLSRQARNKDTAKRIRKCFFFFISQMEFLKVFPTRTMGALSHCRLCRVAFGFFKSDKKRTNAHVVRIFWGHFSASRYFAERIGLDLWVARLLNDEIINFGTRTKKLTIPTVIIVADFFTPYHARTIIIIILIFPHPQSKNVIWKFNQISRK